MNCFGPVILVGHLGKGSEVAKEVVDLMAGKQLEPEFLAMNPLHCVPTFKTAEGETFWEGNVVCTYLASGSDLIPKNRTRMDLALAFRGSVYTSVVPFVYPLLGFAPPLTAETRPKAEAEAKQVFDIPFSFFVMDGSGFVAGSTLTIAD